MNIRIRPAALRGIAAFTLAIAVRGAALSSQPDHVSDTGGAATVDETPGLACVVDPGLVDAFPRLLEWRAPVRSGGRGGDTLAHFVICEVAVDARGRAFSVRALGCEEAKGELCDSLIDALSRAEFSPALRHGEPVPSVVVFGATVAAGDSAAVRVGPPVVGTWSDSLCSYHGRIYGSAELDPADRPFVTRRVPAVRPEGSLPASVASVQLKLVIDPDGAPCFILCEEASPAGHGFVEAAVAAARRYRFEPGRRRGAAQAVWVTLDFRWE